MRVPEKSGWGVWCLKSRGPSLLLGGGAPLSFVSNYLHRTHYERGPCNNQCTSGQMGGNATLASRL